jgi:hypothetical protein
VVILKSKYFSNGALRSLNRMGDILMPAAEGMPAFSDLGCLEHVDDRVAYAPQGDIKLLNLLMTLLSFAPDAMLRFMVHSMQNPDSWPEPIATYLRKLDMDLRGVLYSLYYSGMKGAEFTGRTPLEVMEFEPKRVPRDPAA